jgi:hypothetical protein
MALIPLPEINGIVGAVYDDSLENFFEQSELAQQWGGTVIFTVQEDEQISKYRTLLHRRRCYEEVRLIGDLKLILKRKYHFDISEAGWTNNTVTSIYIESA